jgi:pimeloyl-ACP methyl ester carboxylesterase
LLFVGDRDAFIPLEDAVAMYRLIPNAELAVAPNSSHEFVGTNPELFTNIVLEFMMRQIDW